MDLTSSELESLKRFDQGEGGGWDENSTRLLDLGLIDFEEDIDNVFFWVTGKRQAILDQRSGIEELFQDILPDELDRKANDPDHRTDWEK